MSKARRIGASALMLGTAGACLYAGVENLHFIEWPLVAGSGVLAAAAVGLSRKSLLAQVPSRAAAWLVFLPTAVGAIASTLVSHYPDPSAFLLAAGSGGALLLARPMLHTREAHAEFGPKRFRKWLLAGATSQAAAALITGLFACEGLHSAWRWGGSYASATALFALTGALFMSAFGVLRMRTWGILLGGLTALTTLVTAAVVGGGGGVALALAAVPALLFFVLPILMAQRTNQEVAREAQLRVATYDELEAIPSRVRVVDDEFEDRDELATLHESAEEPRRASIIA